MKKILLMLAAAVLAVVFYSLGRLSAGRSDAPVSVEPAPVAMPSVPQTPMDTATDIVPPSAERPDLAAPAVPEKTKRELHEELDRLQKEEREAEFERQVGHDGYGSRIGRHLSEHSY